MNARVLGWDIGGANLKAVQAARVSTTAETVGNASVVERPFALWRNPHALAAALDEIARSLGPADRIGVTMTVELADCFASKREGIAFVLDAVGTAFPDIEPQIWGVDGRFHSPEAARRRPHLVASANWSATAHLVAQLRPSALIVDVGSTTADIIPIVAGRVAASGRTDPERLRTGELVYTGALRTPVGAIVRRVPLEGGWCRVAAEAFAVAADVHLWLGHISPQEYTCETPDDRGVSRPEVAARLARVVCADPDMLAPGDLDRVARHIARVQRRQVAAAIAQVMRRLGDAAPRTALITGSGAFLGHAAARAAGLETVELAHALDAGSGLVASSPFAAAAARAGPAAAVAWLLAGEET